MKIPVLEDYEYMTIKDAANGIPARFWDICFYTQIEVNALPKEEQDKCFPIPGESYYSRLLKKLYGKL